MTVEYLVLGIVLILMGVVQIWLRHGPGARETEDTAGESGADAGTDSEQPRREIRSYSSAGRVRSGRAWEAWTAILGFVGVALGIVLVVLGVLGR